MPEALQSAEVLVATTWDCNLRCSYCFVKEHAHTGFGSGMEAAQARRVVDVLDQSLAQFESIGIHLYGGEPLTNLPALRAIVERAKEYPAGRFHFAITTNGTVFNDEVFELLDAGRFQVVLSIDGPAHVHDACRRSLGDGGTHAQVMRFLDRLRSETRCWVRGSSVVRAGWSLSEAEDYLHSLPVDVIKAQAVRMPEHDPHGLDGDERQRYMADLDALGERVIADLEQDRIPKDDRFSTRVLQLLKGQARERFCGAGVSNFGITPDGTVRPCVLLEGDEHHLGHVDDPDHGWVAAGANWQAAHGPRAECTGCDALPLCGGGCPAMLSVCGADECDLVRRTCAVAHHIHDHFRERPIKLLTLAGVV